MILLRWYKRYSICLISFLNLLQLFPAFTCANSIGSLVNNLFGVKICDLLPSFTSIYHHVVMTYQRNLQILCYQSILLYQSITFNSQFFFYFLTTLYNNILPEINHQDIIWSSFYFFRHLVIHCIDLNRFLESHYIMLKLYYTHFSFCVSSLLHLFK